MLIKKNHPPPILPSVEVDSSNECKVDNHQFYHTYNAKNIIRSTKYKQSSLVENQYYVSPSQTNTTYESSNVNAFVGTSKQFVNGNYRLAHNHNRLHKTVHYPQHHVEAVSNDHILTYSSPIRNLESKQRKLQSRDETKPQNSHYSSANMEGSRKPNTILESESSQRSNSFMIKPQPLSNSLEEQLRRIERLMDQHKDIRKKLMEEQTKKNSYLHDGLRKDETPTILTNSHQLQSNVTDENTNYCWAEYWDEEVGANYYYNTVTGEASWVKPTC